MFPSSPDPLVLETIDRICKNEIPRFQGEAHYNTVPRALFKVFGDAGVAGLAVPEAFGGIAASASTSAAAFDLISRYDMGPAIFISVHAMACGLITRFGSADQKSSLLPKLASGDLLAAFALTEPGAGSDAQSLTTEAVQDGASFVLKGGKCYITSAGFADLYVVFGRTADASGSGISAFLVPPGIEGFSIGSPEKKMGCELSPIASLFFDGARVPASALLGPLHQGFKVALSGLAGGRVNIAACANGLSRAALDAAVRHLKERRQFGRPLAEFQGLQFMVADMHSRLEASRLLTERAAADLDSPSASISSTRLSSSVAKCFATDSAMSITTDAVQLLGGAGYIRDYAVERYMRDAKMLQIVEGSNQIQRMIISRELLDGQD